MIILSAFGMVVPLPPPGVLLPIGGDGCEVGDGDGDGDGDGMMVGGVGVGNGIDGGEGCTAPLPAPGGVLPPLVVNCKDANKKGTRLKAKMRLLGFNMMVSTNLFI
ncbi:hypothetical protein [Cylindrospermopsis raciborskii]|uniref:hypothetical protein n=1 Tax=Cylindrospermopsis raciborskii TaxID=77022 RepID=UPI0021183023|nr:hypothetical protein [Cylindrospermopsis raciborskii]